MSTKPRTLQFEQCYEYKMTCFGCSRLGISKVFEDEDEYEQHCKDCHEELASFICPACGKKSSSWYNFHSHLTTHRAYCQPPWICLLKQAHSTTECGKRSSTRHNLIKHITGRHQTNVEYNGKHYLCAISSNKKSSRNVQGNEMEKSSGNKNENNHNMNNGNNTSTRKRKKKLRPKMEVNPLKRTRNCQLDSNRNELDELQEPKRKRTRLDTTSYDRESIQSQIYFLHVLYNAAIYVEGHESVNASVSETSELSSLSPRSPSTE